jgi:Family of unknown function (DUF6159)
MRLTRPGARTIATAGAYGETTSRGGAATAGTLVLSLPGGHAVGTFDRSIALAKASWAVLRKDKELAVLPLLSFLSWIVVAVLVFLPISIVAEDSSATESWTSNPVTWVVAFVGYVAISYITIFFNAAIVCGADERLRGGDPTLGSALRGAADRAVVLLPWAVVSATVSIILRTIEERSGIVGRIVVGLIGLAWSLITFLVLPILVVERIGVVQAVKRSSELFKRTWGENVVTNGGIGLLGLLAMLAGAIVVIPLVAIGGPAAVLGVVVAVLWIAAVVCVTTTLTGILQIALYRYAVDGEVPGFGDGQLRDAFRDRGSRRGWLN